jgi:hypothetical protein
MNIPNQINFILTQVSKHFSLKQMKEIVTNKHLNFLCRGSYWNLRQPKHFTFSFCSHGRPTLEKVNNQKEME